MYAYITLKFEILEEEIEENSLAQTFAEEIANYSMYRSGAEDIVKVEIKDD